MHFQNFIVVALPTKNSVFGRISSLPPRSPPPSKAQILFLLSSRPSLTKDGSGLPNVPQNSAEPLGSAGWFCITFPIVKRLLKEGAAELWEPRPAAPAFRPCKFFFWNPLTIYRGLSGSPGPKPPKSLKKVSRGLRPRDPPRVWKKFRKSLESLEKVSRRSRKTFSRLFPDSRGVPGPEAPGFRARRDSCKWSTGSQILLQRFSCFLRFLFCSWLFRGPCVSGFRRRVVMADVPLYRNVLQRVFPCNATLAEESYYS